eukprot:3430078-Rhodomonas_salina.1
MRALDLVAAAAAAAAAGDSEVVLYDDNGEDTAVGCVWKDVDSGFGVQVSAGGQHTCAVDRDDIIYCWGNNADGQLELTGFLTRARAGAAGNARRKVCEDRRGCVRPRHRRLQRHGHCDMSLDRLDPAVSTYPAARCPTPSVSQSARSLYMGGGLRSSVSSSRSVCY